MVHSLEEFGTFFRQAGAHRSSVIVNLTIGDRAPLRNFPNLLRISIPLQDHTDHGLGSSAERPTLEALDRDLVAALDEQCQAHFVARELTRGMMRFYFYSTLDCAPEPAIQEVINRYPGYRFRLSRTRDPEWNVYFDELYPSRIEFQLLADHEREAAAAAAGDELEVPRPICHWAYFPSAECREKFLQVVHACGFLSHLLDPLDPEASTFGYCAELSRNDRADHPYLDDLVMWLHAKADEFAGYYDNFEAESIGFHSPGLSATAT